MRLDFEGDDELYPSFHDRLQRAAERHTWERPDGRTGYPSQACAYVDREEVLEVGKYDPAQGNLKVTRPDLMTDWV